MNKFFAASLGLLITTHVFAHGPTRQQVVEEITINAPVDKTWSVVGDFSALHIWHPTIQSTEMQGDNIRILSLGDNKKITEKLVKRDNDKKMLKYKIVDMTTLETFEFAGRQVERKVLPVNTYTGFLTVNAEGDGSKVTWKGKFYRPYLLNPPTPEGMSDKDAVDTMHAVYKQGLEHLKSLLEKQANAD